MNAVNNTILIIEDDLGLNELISEKIKEIGFKTVSAFSGMEAINWLINNKPLLMIVDYSLSDMTAKEFIDTANIQGLDLPPFIVSTGQGNERIAVDMMKLGARDYIIKDTNLLELMPRVVNRVVNEIQNEIKLKLAEKELHNNELRFKVLFEDAPDAMLLADPDSGKIVDANNAAMLLFKKQKSELLGLFQYELHPSKNIELSISSFKNHFEKAIETGKNVPIENLILTSDGTEIPVEILGQSIQIGEKVLLLGTFRDITERKKAEIALKESETKFRNFFQNSVVGKTITSIDGKLSVNNAFCKIVGYTEDELNKLNWRDITYKEDIEPNENYVSEILKGNLQSMRWEKRYIHKDGQIVWVDINTTLQRDDNGKPLYFITALIDITDKKKAEEKLKQSEEEFRNLIELSPLPMFIIHEWKTKYFNPAAIKLFGAKSLSEVVERNILDFVHPSCHEQTSKNSALLKQTGLVPKQEQKYLKLDGSLLEVETQAKSIKFYGKPATLVVINDITELKKAVEALIKKNADLDYMNKFMVNREVRMAEMKREVNELLERLGEEKRYL